MAFNSLAVFQWIKIVGNLCPSLHWKASLGRWNTSNLIVIVTTLYQSQQLFLLIIRKLQILNLFYYNHTKIYTVSVLCVTTTRNSLRSWAPGSAHSASAAWGWRVPPRASEHSPGRERPQTLGSALRWDSPPPPDYGGGGWTQGSRSERDI